MTPGSDLPSCLDDDAINWHKEGKVNSVPAELSLGYLSYIHGETSKHMCRCGNVMMGTRSVYESIMCGDFPEQTVLGGEERNQEGILGEIYKASEKWLDSQKWG